MIYNDKMKLKDQDRTGKLIVVPTPIGNLGDITFRAISALKEADLLLCEDTRTSRKLLDHYGISQDVISYRDQNHARVIDRIIKELIDGRTLALISDAGTPSISDPGYKLIKRVIELGFNVESLPGPSAVTSALVLSGLPTDRFLFLGFLPKSSSKREDLLRSYMEQELTILIYESPFRIIKLLDEIVKIDDTRTVAIINDISKLYERTWRGTATNLLTDLSKVNLKGEFVVAIGKSGFSFDLI